MKDLGLRLIFMPLRYCRNLAHGTEDGWERWLRAGELVGAGDLFLSRMRAGNLHCPSFAVALSLSLPLSPCPSSVVAAEEMDSVGLSPDVMPLAYVRPFWRGRS